MQDKTIRSLLYVSILSAALLFFTGFSAVHTHKLCETWMREADLCLDAVEEGQLSDAYRQLTELEKKWLAHQLFIAATQTHDDIDTINTAFRTAYLHLSHNCTDEFYTEIAALRDTFEKMHDIQQISFENIL